MTKSHRGYQFGSFDERLAHLCALFETEPPEIVYEDGQPTLTDPLMEWIKEHDINLDWLFVGSPCAMLREWSKERRQSREMAEINRQLEPQVQDGLLALLKAVVQHNLPMEESLAIFDQVVKDFRASKAA